MNNNNNNNAKIKNNYGRLQDLILLFKIPMGTRNNFFEIYGKFGHGPSEKINQPCPKALPSNTSGKYHLLPNSD